MKIYFPQWQGSGVGSNIAPGAKTVLDYVNDSEYLNVPLSAIKAGAGATQHHCINNYDAIVEQLSRLKKVIAEDKPETIRIIGGDCGLEIVPVSYLNKKYNAIGIIWFDAHADINRPCDSASCNFHGMPLRTLLGEGEPNMDHLLFSTITEEQIHYVGLRDIDAAEQERLNAGGIYHPRETDPMDLVKTLKKKRLKQLYIHFDFDCLEPNEYDKTYYQVANGVSIATAEQTILALKENFDIVGSSVLESVTTEPTELVPITGILNLLLKTN